MTEISFLYFITNKMKKNKKCKEKYFLYNNMYKKYSI